jgi:hypothetical protein
VWRRDSEANAVVAEGFISRREEVGRRIGKEGIFDYICDVVSVFETDDCVDLACLTEQLFTEALREAAGDYDFSHPALLLLLDGVAYCINRFGFGGCDEATGVDNDDIGVVGILVNDEAGLCDLRQHPFAIDHIFWTAEGDKSDSYPAPAFAYAGTSPFFVLFCGHWPI